MQATESGQESHGFDLNELPMRRLRAGMVLGESILTTSGIIPVSEGS
jgi:hypothetical protein